MHMSDIPAEQPPSPSNTGPTFVVSTLTTGLTLTLKGNCVVPALVLARAQRISDDSEVNTVNPKNCMVPSLAVI